jgi:L-malate glycosyltransferase
MHTLTEKQPLRVCFLIDALALAGTESQLLALVRRLDRSRVAPYLCLLRGRDAGPQDLLPTEVPVLDLRVGSLCRPRTVLAAWRFTRWLRREKIDVVQAYFPDSSYFGIPLAWLAGVPHRVRVRNNLGHWLTPLHRFLGRMLRRITTLSLTNCEAGRARLIEDERCPADTVRVLPNGVDLDRFLHLPGPARQSGGPRRVGLVANLRHVKGIDVLIRAASLLSRSHPEVVFEVAGEGEMRGELERILGDAGLSERFHLPGAISDIPAFLGRLDVAVLCSRSEGMSNALLEYMAAARPIVATATGAAVDLIVDGVYGLLTPTDNPEALASALDRLLRNPEQGWRMGQAARQRALAHYSREAMVRRFEEFYESLEQPQGIRRSTLELQRVA